jgi:hypothetical protein
LKQFAILIHNFEFQKIEGAMIQVILLVITGLLTSLTHPFHISICELAYDEESGSLQITSRIFQDDFEVALDHLTQINGYFSQVSAADAERQLQLYFDEHLKVIVDQKPLKHKLLGFEIEDNVVWCYLEIEQVDPIEEITVQYSVLINTFNDQINLAHIKCRGKVKSLKFQRNQLLGTAAFTN